MVTGSLTHIKLQNSGLYVNSTKNTKEKACAVNIKNLQTVVVLYLNDNSDKIDADVDDINILAPYMKNNIIPSCPVDSTNSYSVKDGIVSCSGVADGDTDHIE